MPEVKVRLHSVLLVRFPPQHQCHSLNCQMQWRLSFDVRGRYRVLEQFYHRQGWSSEASWTKRLLQRLDQHLGPDQNSDGDGGTSAQPSAANTAAGAANAEVIDLTASPRITKTSTSSSSSPSPSLPSSIKRAWDRKGKAAEDPKTAEEDDEVEVLDVLPLRERLKRRRR